MVKKAIKEKFQKIKKFFKENTISALTAVFLGIATLLVAWAGWIGALHDGNQAGNYTQSNNMAAEGNAEYNVATQVYISDLFTWNTIASLKLDMEIAKEKGDLDEAKIIKTKIDKIEKENCSPRLQEAMKEINAKGEGGSPFENEEFTSGYFDEAKETLAKSQEFLENGEIDNQRSDSYQLASVLYSLVLFLLGLVGVLQDYHTRKFLLVFSVCILIMAFLYMLTIPMPTGFAFGNFFNVK